MPSKGRWKIAVTTQRFGQHLIEADLGSSQHPKKTWSIGFSQCKGKKTRPILEFYQFSTSNEKEVPIISQQNLLTMPVPKKTSTKNSFKKKTSLIEVLKIHLFFFFGEKREQPFDADLLIFCWLFFFVFFVPSEASRHSAP